MSSSTDLFICDNAASDVAGLLSRGAIAIARAREVRDRSEQTRIDATWHRQEAYDVILRFIPHRLGPISGADGLAAEGRRSALRVFALFGTPKTFVGLSRGARCDACGSMIRVGDVEYEVVADGHEMRMESDCYLLLVDELEKLAPRSDSAR